MPTPQRDNADLYSLWPRMQRSAGRDGWLHCTALLDPDKRSGELCHTEVAGMKVKTKLSPVRIAKRRASCACTLPVLIILMVLGSAVGRAQSVSVEDARCRALATTDFSTVPDAPTRISEATLVKDVQGLTGKAASERRPLKSDWPGSAHVPRFRLRRTQCRLRPSAAGIAVER